MSLGFLLLLSSQRLPEFDDDAREIISSR